MAQTIRTIPASFPQPLGNRLLNADTQRQISILRQEVVTELLAVLGEVREGGVRTRLIKIIETNLRQGLAAARRSEELWPSVDEVKQTIQARPETKPALVNKHLKLFEQYDRVQHRSLGLLADSFEHIRVILDRVQPPEPMPAKPTVKGNSQ